MTGATLILAALLALASGQRAEDRKQFTAYQVKLASIRATESAAAAAATVTVISPASPAAAAQGACTLAPGSGNSATTQDCTACHVGFQRGHSHPVDVFQDSARSRSLRPAADVVKRGVLLAEGKVTCLSCHDGNSPWKAKLALPPDALLREPVKPGNPQTYDPAQIRPSAMTGLTATTGKQRLPAGTEVSPTPLCKACHAFD